MSLENNDRPTADFSKHPAKPGLLSFKNTIFILLLLAALGAAGYFFWQWQQEKQPGGEEIQIQAEQEAEIMSLVEEVGQLIVLPANETPTLVTIKDVTEIQENREFFAEAENGDKVLVYQQAKKAFLYRPSTKKLINLAPININQTNQTQPIEESPADETLSAPEETTFTVELRNGTSQSGLTHSFEPTLLANFALAQVSLRSSAANVDYSKTTVSANPSKGDLAQRVANKLGFEVADLPPDEALSSADIVIILGADQL